MMLAKALLVLLAGAACFLAGVLAGRCQERAARRQRLDAATIDFRHTWSPETRR